MIKKTLYFGNPAYLSFSRKQLVIRLPEVEQAEGLSESFRQEATRTIPLEDIGVVVLDHPRITLTQKLLDQMLQNRIAVISCDEKHLPMGLFLPLSGNTLCEERFRTQMEASLPLKKQLWQQTMRAKILNQAAVLRQETGEDHPLMRRLADTIKSGDADNHEAQAAVYYWKNVFRGHPDFIRDPDGAQPNALLNYGYAILRAVVARALVCSGLLPMAGIHHHNRYNAYCLADDIMEPYRPFVDAWVIHTLEQTELTEELSAEARFELLAIPNLEVCIDQKRTPLLVAVSQTTSSLVKCLAGESRKIIYPVYTC